MTWTQGSRTGRAWLLAAATAIALACGSQEDPVSGAGFRDLPADHVALNLDTPITEMGSLRARVHADTAYIWEDSARMLMFPVDLKLYDRNGAETAHLTADEGELDSNTNKMVARGNVVLVTTEEDRRILTEELHYDPRSGRIWSDVHTVMFDGETRLEGAGFQANEDMTDVEVFESTGENIEIEF
ncbi:MAG: LPS export ABC transporter periplasmic protein LptC [Gemmatimonadota bacterium]